MRTIDQVRSIFRKIEDRDLECGFKPHQHKLYHSVGGFTKKPAGTGRQVGVGERCTMAKLKLVIDSDIDFKLEVKAVALGRETSVNFLWKKVGQSAMGLSEGSVNKIASEDSSEEDSE